MGNSNYYVVFSIGEQCYSLPLSSVEKIVRVVEITSLPKAPDMVMGVINVQGNIVPVVNLRILFNLPKREIHLSDFFIIVRTKSDKSIAFLIEKINEIKTYESNKIISSESIFHGVKYLKEVIKLKDGMSLVIDVDNIFSSDALKEMH